MEGAVEYLKKHHVPYNPDWLAEIFGDSRGRLISTFQSNYRSRHNGSIRFIDTRGQRKELTGAQIVEVDSIIEANEEQERKH